MTRVLFFIAFIAACRITLQAQSTCPPYWNDIEKFKKEDSVQAPPKNAILFVGSSSFTLWKDVQAYFPGYTIINRGFGGSTLTDVIRYTYDVILPYNPRQVIIYCGENDFASSDSIQAADVVLRFKTLFGIIRQNLPQAYIHFVSLKPSPSRQEYLTQFKSANMQIKTFLQKQQRAGFIDVYQAMLMADGSPRTDIFLDDNLHMKAEGYRIWQKILKPYLRK